MHTFLKLRPNFRMTGRAFNFFRDRFARANMRCIDFRVTLAAGDLRMA